MGSLVSCVATGLGFCFCSACSSLLGACCGNDKPSTVPPSVTSGRKRSVFLLVIALGLALAFQYGVAPWLVDNEDFTGFIAENWLEGCEQYDSVELRESCAGNQGVYRVSASAVVFFCLAAIVVVAKPTFNREVWPAKYVLFLFLCAATIFIPNEPLFSDVFLNVGRVGGAAFICLQQLIVIDMAYAWNDSWVAKADTAESEEMGSGRKWLGAILTSAFCMFAGAIGGIAVLFIHFTGCTSNDAFIIVTIIMMVLITAAQLSGEEGNLLSSAAVSLWAVFLCYTAVAKNPDESCNPQYGEQDKIGVVLSIIVMGISMCWTGWSYTAEDRLTQAKSNEEPLVRESSNSNGSSRKVSGVVTGYGTSPDEEDRHEEAIDEDDEANSPKHLSNSWKLNIMLACITCWMAMALTSWGEIIGDGTAANASVGRVGMWIVISSQWLVLALYLW
eukprot:CAMPEP_0172476966 /NCGR_PEP_ID=MMETSP1065-20121228/70651_1 /TAXON_ID=265537 /ORGANISM="Amphiprora paludosa, Strain CCMP125" /LENGTH=445 /DNA_ID=CAMNT_0013235203 /DNA_START=421 /DNA_END=1755 /DNA_ORIENTATION=+